MKRSSSGEPERVSAFGAAFRPLDGLAHRDGFGGHAVKRVKSSSSSDGAPEGFNLVERISDPHKLASRRKQIDFGKNTLSYERYSREVPRSARKETDPKTPDITNPMSKRRFDGMIKAWRRGLHEWEQNNPLPGASGGSEEHQAGHDAPARAGLSGCADNFDDYLDGVVRVCPPHVHLQHLPCEHAWRWEPALRPLPTHRQRHPPAHRMACAPFSLPLARCSSTASLTAMPARSGPPLVLVRSRQLRRRRAQLLPTRATAESRTLARGGSVHRRHHSCPITRSRSRPSASRRTAKARAASVTPRASSAVASTPSRRRTRRRRPRSRRLRQRRAFSAPLTMVSAEYLCHAQPRGRGCHMWASHADADHSTHPSPVPSDRIPSIRSKSALCPLEKSNKKISHTYRHLPALSLTLQLRCGALGALHSPTRLCPTARGGVGCNNTNRTTQPRL
jgi:hypothetical protein